MVLLSRRGRDRAVVREKRPKYRTKISNKYVPLGGAHQKLKTNRNVRTGVTYPMAAFAVVNSDKAPRGTSRQ